MTTSDKWGTNPLIGAAGAAARADWRAEQEAVTADAAEVFNHARHMSDLLVECMRNGDRVAVVVGPHRAVGMIVEVAADLLALRNVGSGRLDFQLRTEVPFQLFVQERGLSQSGGDAIASGSFRARLLDREAAGGESTVGSLSSTEPLDGKLIVGADHVRVVARGGGETLLPMHALAYVSSRRD